MWCMLPVMNILLTVMIWSFVCMCAVTKGNILYYISVYSRIKLRQQLMYPSLTVWMAQRLYHTKKKYFNHAASDHLHYEFVKSTLDANFERAIGHAQNRAMDLHGSWFSMESDHCRAFHLALTSRQSMVGRQVQEMQRTDQQSAQIRFLTYCNISSFA